MVRGQGVEAEGQIKTVPKAGNAIRLGLADDAGEHPHLIDVRMNFGNTGQQMALGE